MKINSYRYNRQYNNAGFTLIEMLIVVIIMGILALAIVPHVTTSTDEAKVSTLKSNLAVLRSAIELYYVQHGNTYPTADNQLTRYTNSAGADVATPGAAHPFGPYLKEPLPSNPFNNLSTINYDGVSDLATAKVGNDSHGWELRTLVGLVFADTNAYKDF